MTTPRKLATATAIALGACEDFALMAATTATCGGAPNCNNIDGCFAVSPGMSITGNFVGEVVSNIDSAPCAVDGLAAWTAGRLMTGTTIPAEMGGETFGPGVYVHGSALNIALTNPVFTLDAGGDSDAVFIFNAGTTLTTSAGSEIMLLNGAKAGNVFWIFGTGLTMGADSTWRATCSLEQPSLWERMP